MVKFNRYFLLDRPNSSLFLTTLTLRVNTQNVFTDNASNLLPDNSKRPIVCPLNATFTVLPRKILKPHVRTLFQVSVSSNPSRSILVPNLTLCRPSAASRLYRRSLSPWRYRHARCLGQHLQCIPWCTFHHYN